jgi:hypothetical protein
MGNENMINSCKHALYPFNSSAIKTLLNQAPEKYALKYGDYCAMARSQGSLAEVKPQPQPQPHWPNTKYKVPQIIFPLL